MGGVIITLDENEAGKRFIELGMKEFAEKMDPYKQVGLNGQLEEGKISEEEYRREVCKKIGREVTFEELQHCWLGYMKEIPERNLVTLRNLKKQGYRVILLSNTNPYVSAWVDSEALSDASFTQMTGPSYSGAIFRATCSSLVVAPPTMIGMRKPAFCISRAT
jgi:5-amino-6-(5-phospho-D-ribitylamino)uracil phosphatase